MSSTPVTLAQIGPDSNARCLDHLAQCVAIIKYYAKMLPIIYPNEERARAEDYHRTRMSDTDKLAFDCFLVRMKDPLASEPGTSRYRFVTRALRMLELSRKA